MSMTKQRHCEEKKRKHSYPHIKAKNKKALFPVMSPIIILGSIGYKIFLAWKKYKNLKKKSKNSF